MTIPWNFENSSFVNAFNHLIRYKKVNELKQTNPNLKTLLAVGGWNMGSIPFSEVVATKQTRQKFISSSIQFLRARNFDGLDISWEYPTKRNSPADDQEKFGLLLKVSNSYYKCPKICNKGDKYFIQVQ